MRRATGVVALAALFLAGPLAEGCGDKLLSIARGMRLKQTYQARHPASIMMYVGDISVAKSSKDERNRLVQMSILYMSLRQAGHRLEVAQTPEELSDALRKGRFDFVMADVKDVGAVTVRVVASSRDAELLPIMFKPKKSDFAAARQQFKLVLKTPATSVDHLEAIDRAMESAPLGD